MKIIHTSDLHLASPLSTRLASSKVSSRKRELMANMLRLTAAATEQSAAAIIIAGDLFDSEKIGKRELDSVISVIKGVPDIAFLYLPGNHERDVIERHGDIPENLHIFGKGWGAVKLGNVTVYGRSETAAGMFDTIDPDPLSVNIAVLHGELRDKSAEGGAIGLGEIGEKKIDYLALGHYHSYSQTEFGRNGRGKAVYCGTLEGRGFDETGDKGFCLINIDEGEVSHRFIPFAKRRLHEIEVDISGATDTHELILRIISAIGDIPKEDMVRICFIGSRELDLRYDKLFICEKFSTGLYYFEIKDKSKLCTRAEDYRYDKSLRGEFIRLCLDDATLDDKERELIIHCGLSALAGEALDDQETV